MDKKYSNQILKETEIGYDLVSGKFSQTRKHFWSELGFIKNYAKNEDNILDFGCGNGRLLEIFKDKNINYIGTDVSQKLINLAKNQYNQENIEFIKINPNQSSLSFQDNFFNSIYSIATFHHFPDLNWRKEIVDELYRILKPNGYVIITVWNLWQKKYFKSILKNWMNKIFRTSKLDWNDCYVDFKNNDGKVFSRYHHAFTENDLRTLFVEAGFKIERCEIIEKRNIVLIATK